MGCGLVRRGDTESGLGGDGQFSVDALGYVPPALGKPMGQSLRAPQAQVRLGSVSNWHERHVAMRLAHVTVLDKHLIGAVIGGLPN